MQTHERKQYQKNQGTRGRIAAKATHDAACSRPLVEKIRVIRPVILGCCPRGRVESQTQPQARPIAISFLQAREFWDGGIAMGGVKSHEVRYP